MVVVVVGGGGEWWRWVVAVKCSKLNLFRGSMTTIRPAVLKECTLLQWLAVLEDSNHSACSVTNKHPPEISQPIRAYL